MKAAILLWLVCIGWVAMCLWALAGCSAPHERPCYEWGLRSDVRTVYTRNGGVIQYVDPQKRPVCLKRGESDE